MTGVKKNILAWLLMLNTMYVHAEMSIDIVGAGEHQIPIALLTLEGDPALSASIQKVVRSDLQGSGLFHLIDVDSGAPKLLSDIVFSDWQVAGVDALAVGQITGAADGRIHAQIRLFDVPKKTALLGEIVSADASQIRQVGHRIADLIYEKLTGDKGVFSSHIAYVNRHGEQFHLLIADSDGLNERTVLSQQEPIMSPAWSADGSQLAYVSFETGHAAIFLQSMATKQRQLIADFSGSNSAPAWSPDGKKLAIVLSREGSSQLYLIGRDGSGLKRISFSEAIDTEPNFSPDGQSILFTSDRGGSAQIYRLTLADGKIQRITFGEGTSYSARYSPDGKSFVFVHRKSGKFYVAIHDFQSGQVQFLSEGVWEKKPSFAPNGKIVLFASESKGRGILVRVSSDGRVKQFMSTQVGDAREPVWSPHF
jgi:TolB protein